MNIKITTYGKSILIAMAGIYMASAHTGYLFSIVSGVFIGTALQIARRAGQEENL